jgi:hypothetical protein
MSVQAPVHALVRHQAALAAVQTWRQNQNETRTPYQRSSAQTPVVRQELCRTDLRDLNPHEIAPANASKHSLVFTGGPRRAKSLNLRPETFPRGPVRPDA